MKGNDFRGKMLPLPWFPGVGVLRSTAAAAGWAVLVLTVGCACRDGVTKAQPIALRIQPPDAAITVKAKARGRESKVIADENGLYNFEIPGMRWADIVCLGLIPVRTRSDDAEPFLYVLRPDGTTSHFSARQILRLPVDTNGASVLKVKR